MELSTIVEIIVNNGVALGVVLYFLWKDSKLTKENTEILNQIKSLLDIIVQEKIKRRDKNE